METVIIKFVADTDGLQPAIKQLELIGKITSEDAAKFNAINQEQKEFIQNLNKSTTEMGKLSGEVEGLMSEIQAGIMEGFADHLEEVTKETKKSATGFKSMKQELRELKAQIASGSLGEKELKAATKRAAELQDNLGDVNDKIKALASDTKRIDAVVTAFRGLAGAISVGAGAASLFGSENEKLQQTLMKAQGAMALLQGVQELANIATTEGALKTMVLDGAQKAVTATSRIMGISIAQATAVATAGLSLLVAGLAYLVTEMAFANDEVEDLQKKIDEFRATSEIFKKINDDTRKHIQDGRKRELEQLKADNEREKLELLSKYRQGLITAENYTIAFDQMQRNFRKSQEEINAKYNAQELQAAKEHGQKLNKARLDAEADFRNKQNAQIREEIAEFELLMRETADPSQKIKYYAEITRLKQAQIDLDISLGAKEKMLQKELLNDQLAAYREQFNIIEEETEQHEETVTTNTVLAWKLRIDRVNKLIQDAEKQKRAQALMWTQFSIDQAKVVSDTVFQINADNRRTELDSQLSMLNDMRDAELSNKSLTDAQKIQLQKKYDREEAALKQQAWNAEKQAALAQAGINTALAVTKAWATVPPPANVPAAIAAGVAGAAQIAIIANTKPPKFEKGGEVGGQLHVSGGTLIEAERGEYVVNRKSTSEFRPTIEAINHGAVEPTLANNIFEALQNGTFDLAAQYHSNQADNTELIDYGRLANVMERSRSNVSINIDENGFEKYVQKQYNTIRHKNSKLRIKQ